MRSLKHRTIGGNLKAPEAKISFHPTLKNVALAWRGRFVMPGLGKYVFINGACYTAIGMHLVQFSRDPAGKAYYTLTNDEEEIEQVPLREIILYGRYYREQMELALSNYLGLDSK